MKSNEFLQVITSELKTALKEMMLRNIIQASFKPN